MKINPITELRLHLHGVSLRCRARRWLNALFHIEVARDIAADVERERQRIESLAYADEQADAEAYKTLRAISADGYISKDEMPRFRQALRQIHRSGRIAHQIGQHARA